MLAKRSIVSEGDILQVLNAGRLKGDIPQNARCWKKLKAWWWSLPNTPKTIGSSYATPRRLTPQFHTGQYWAHVIDFDVASNVSYLHIFAIKMGVLISGMLGAWLFLSSFHSGTLQVNNSKVWNWFSFFAINIWWFGWQKCGCLLLFIPMSFQGEIQLSSRLLTGMRSWEWSGQSNLF